MDVYGPPSDVVTLPSMDVPPVPDSPADPGEDFPQQSAPEFSRRGRSDIITIDPGHGGEDYGVHPSETTLEKDFNARISGLVRDRLRDTSFSGEMTRSRDINLSLDQRSSIANLNRSRAFISIHSGASAGTEASGPVVYVHGYSSASPKKGELRPWIEGQRDHLVQSRKLAGLLQSQLNAVFGVENGVREAPLAILAPIMGPAVLVEAGFLTNQSDLDRLQDPEFQGRLADAITAALMRFLQ